MDNLKLGQIITGDANRDAIHIAIAPAIAAERLAPGQHVGFIGEAMGPSKTPIGVVDPYLEGAVFKGDRFWLFLYPNTVTSLRHQWEHPAFEGKAQVIGASEARLRAFADTADLSYTELMSGAKEFLHNGEYMCDGGKWEGFGITDNFWDDYEQVTGDKVPEIKRHSFFSCSC